MTRKEAKIKVAQVAIANAKKAGRKEPNILDAVPVCVTPEYLATLRKAFGIKTS